MRVAYIGSVCISQVFGSSISEAAKMGHHPWEANASWEDWDALTYPQKCVHVATPKNPPVQDFHPERKTRPCGCRGLSAGDVGRGHRLLATRSKAGAFRSLHQFQGCPDAHFPRSDREPGPSVREL